MQVDKNVLVLQEFEKSILQKDPDDLSPAERKTLIADSSAFTSEDYSNYVD